MSLGPILLVGIDTEYGIRPGNITHGSIDTWKNILLNGIVNNVSNGKNRILVIGGHKANGEIRDFWQKISTALGIPVDFRHQSFLSTSQIKNVNFGNYSVIAVANSVDGSGKLTQRELKALNKRKNDVGNFICNGGGLFASACDFEKPYDYLSKIGTVGVNHHTYSDITPTTEGQLMGISNTNLDSGPWHVRFTSFPDFLKVLANISNGNGIAAIGGIGRETNVNLSLQSDYCLSDEIVGNTSGTQNAQFHFWSIQESDASWNGTGQEISSNFSGPPPETFDLKSFYTSKGGSWKCNQHYRIKIAIGNFCNGWVEKVKLIYIKPCPVANAGPDIDWCISGGPPPKLGTPGTSGNTYLWSPTTGLDDPTLAQPSLSIIPVHKYVLSFHLTVTNSLECTSSDSVTIKVLFPPNLAGIKIQTNQGCGGFTLSPIFQGVPSNYPYFSFLWSNGETSSSITVFPQISATFSLTISNACGSSTKSISVPRMPHSGQFPQLFIPTAFSPNGDNTNDTWEVIAQVTPNNPINNPQDAYNAFEYELSIFDRWGGLVFHMVETNNNGFAQGHISWDGIANQEVIYSWWHQLWNGSSSITTESPVPEGSYVWRLWLTNCSHQKQNMGSGSITLIR
ncbi:MAG: gliding motility-associated C-terminal domain-containing protein [Bacteroidia bacterium]|nr:gliding motility-associated C-terminal domain-containing protein [Bacteroidia bacterium]